MIQHRDAINGPPKTSYKEITRNPHSTGACTSKEFDSVMKLAQSSLEGVESEKVKTPGNLLPLYWILIIVLIAADNRLDDTLAKSVLDMSPGKAFHCILCRRSQGSWGNHLPVYAVLVCLAWNIWSPQAITVLVSVVATSRIWRELLEQFIQPLPLEFREKYEHIRIEGHGAEE